MKTIEFQKFGILEVPDDYSSLNNGFTFTSDGKEIPKWDHMITSFDGSAIKFNHDDQQYNTADHQGLILSRENHYGSFNDLYFDKIKSLQNEPRRKTAFAESHQILRNRFQIFNAETAEVLSHDKGCSPKLCTNEILKWAAEMFIQGSSKDGGELALLNHPYANSFIGMKEEDARGLQLIHYLLLSAEKVVLGRFECARMHLLVCDALSSDKGNTVERLVYYFSEALHERIDRETGTVTPKGLGKKQSLDLEEAMMSLNPDMAAKHKHIPFSQVCQFAGIQAILDHVSEAKRIHIIDLEIRSGIQHTILMQALATRIQGSPEYLKVTAIGTKSKGILEETGRRLSSFAESLNLGFSFHIVMVADFMELSETMFDLNADDGIAVYIEYFMLFMIAYQDRLEHLMTVFRTIHPCLLIMTEVQGNQNSPVFGDRFTEALFHYGAFFDCLEDCLKHDEASRALTESAYFSQGIRTVVAAEGQERTIRHVTMKIWRQFFAKFAMVEEELSTSSMFQAHSVLKNFACGNSCTLQVDEKSLIVGWKGTPLISLSAWKFE